MERWVREDGRFYCVELARDLFGLVVMVSYGGATPARVRSIPVSSVDAAAQVIAQIGKRRAAHGYRRAG